MGFKNTLCEFGEFLSQTPVIGGIFKPSNKVAVIRLSGVISDAKRGSSISYSKYHKIIENAFSVHNLQAVALVINSPGGSPAQSALIGNLVRNLSIEKEVPVYAFVEDVAASGGYWLACAADEIYAQESSVVGSIGVIAATFGFKDLIERYGIERRLYTAGKEKSMLDPFQEEKPSDVKKLKKLQKEIHDIFINWVRERRGEKLKGADKDLFEGQIWTAQPACENGIIDGVADIRGYCRDKFGKEVKFKEFGPERGLVAGLLSGSDARTSIADDFCGYAEEKFFWNRYGL